MSRPDAGNKNEPAHVLYARLLLKHKNAEEKIRKLKELISKKDNSISKERYDTLISQSEKITAETGPQIETLKKEIDLQLKQLFNDKNNQTIKINFIEHKLSETKQLYSQQIINNATYQDEITQYKTELKPLTSAFKKNNEKINEITKALNVKENTGSSVKVKNDDKDLTGIKKYFNKIKSSDSYMFRFFNTILIIQALCLLMFVVFRFLLLLDLYKLIPLAALGFLAVGIVFIFYFLIISIKAKVGMYFGSSIFYLIISIVLFFQIGFIDGNFSGFFADSFIGLISFWNLIFSIILLTFGCIRTFFLGIKQDYIK